MWLHLAAVPRKAEEGGRICQCIDAFKARRICEDKRCQNFPNTNDFHQDCVEFTAISERTLHEGSMAWTYTTEWRVNKKQLHTKTVRLHWAQQTMESYMVTSLYLYRTLRAQVSEVKFYSRNKKLSNRVNFSILLLKILWIIGKEFVIIL